MEMNLVVDRVMSTFFQCAGRPAPPLPTPTIAPLGCFHAPVSLKDSLFAPSLGLVFQRSLRPPPRAYFENLVRIVAERRAQSIDDLTALGERVLAGNAPRADVLVFASFAGAVLTVMVGAIAYIEDFCNRNCEHTPPYCESKISGDEGNLARYRSISRVYR